MGSTQERRSYNIQYEHNRLAEDGFLEASRRISLVENLRSEIAERVQMVNPFELQLAASQVTAKGYEHRGDISSTFKKSEDVAEQEGRDPVAKRFALENEGYEAAQKEFATRPLFSTVALFSPAPSIPIEGYPGYNLMYFYHILPGKEPGTRTIKALSYINHFDQKEQAEILENIERGKPISPTEEDILLSPRGVDSYSVTPDTTSFRSIWKEVEKVYKRKQRDFKIPSVDVAENYLLFGEMAWKHRHAKIQSMMENIAQSIEYGVSENDEDLQERWRILLNLADKELLHADFSEYMPIINVRLPLVEHTDARVLFDAYAHLNGDVRQTTTSCGTSGGLGRKNIFVNPLKTLIQQAQISTASFEINISDPLENVIEEDEEFDGFECPKCSFKTKSPVGDACPSCKLTKEEFAKQGNTVC